MKTSLKRVAVAALFAGLTSGALAQTYSVNAVGYIKLVLPPGNTLVSTPFVKVGGGVPTITDVFGTNVPNGASVLIYKTATKNYDTFNYINGQWYKGATGGQGTNLLHRGAGFWFRNPTTSNLTVNVVGEVPGGDDFQFELVNLPTGLKIVSFSFPTVTAFEDSGLTANSGDSVMEWVGNGYRTYNYINGKWYVGATVTPLVFQPGKSYWYRNASTPKDWSQPKLYNWP
jgi:hypothetical protein